MAGRGAPSTLTVITKASLLLYNLKPSDDHLDRHGTWPLFPNSQVAFDTLMSHAKHAVDALSRNVYALTQAPVELEAATAAAQVCD